MLASTGPHHDMLCTTLSVNPRTMILGRQKLNTRSCYPVLRGVRRKYRVHSKTDIQAHHSKYLSRGCGGESHHRYIGEGSFDRPQLRVIRAEVMAPRGHAVGLVNHKTSQHTLRLSKARREGGDMRFC